MRRPGPVGQTIYALLGAFLFSAYIVYDVHLLIARKYISQAGCPTASGFLPLFCVAVWRGSTSLIVAGFSLDDYIWASVTLYLDIINL